MSERNQDIVSHPMDPAGRDAPTAAELIEALERCFFNPFLDPESNAARATQGRDLLAMLRHEIVRLTEDGHGWDILPELKAENESVRAENARLTKKLDEILSRIGRNV